MSIVIRTAQVLTLDECDTEHACADIVIEDGKIVAIGPDAATRWRSTDSSPPKREIDGRGLLAMPGLVNGHFHSPGNLMAGALVDRPLELFMLYEVPPLADAFADERLGYLQTMLGAVEMLKGGVTAVHDDPYYNPWPTMPAINAVMQAYADSGLRATVSINHPDLVEYERYPFLADLLPPHVRAEMDAARRFSVGDIMSLYRWFHETWHGAADGRLRVAISNSAPQRVSNDYFAALSAFSRANDLPFDTHMLETKLQRVMGEEKWGRSLVQHVHDLGFLDERMLVIHAIWTDDADIALLAEAGCTVAHNPICNLKLGSGIMPFRKMQNAGVPLCLGTDERNVDDAINVWNVAKTAGMIHNITEPDYRDWPQPLEILHAATRGGARGMRLSDRIGMLKPGYEADLILVDLNTLPFTPLNDLRRHLVFCENGSSVVMTMVAGNVVAERGRVLTIDEAAIRAEIAERMPQIREGFAQTDAAAERLHPYYRDMVLRAGARDVGMKRKPY